jgi:hypothetical protein
MLQVLLVLMSAYSSAAMGQLFFFHVVLIRKVIIMFALETITENIIYVGLMRQSKDLMAKKRDPPGYLCSFLLPASNYPHFVQQETSCWVGASKNEHLSWC